MKKNSIKALMIFALLLFSTMTALAVNREYLIITPAAFAQTAQRLLDFRGSQGFTGYIMTLEYIRDHYNGVDIGEKIRDCVRDFYNNCNTRFLLLAGDTDLIPVRQLVVNLDGDIENHLRKKDDTLSIFAPSDLYYVCIDGEFNSDNDAFWGEITDNNGNSPDWEPELAVGRLPAGSRRELDYMINKIVKYEINHSDKKNVFLVGENLSEGKKGGGGGGPVVYGKDKLEAIFAEAFPGSLNYSKTTLYEADGDYTGDDVVAYLNSSSFDMVINIQHANPGSLLKMIPYENFDIPELAPATDLTNNDPFFVISSGCQAACYKTNDGFNEFLTTKLPYGAYAYIGSSSYGYFVVDNDVHLRYSSGYMKSFMEIMFARRTLLNRRARTLGRLLNDARNAQFDGMSTEEINNAFNAYTGLREMHYNMSLIGDPLSVLYKENLSDLPPLNTPYLKLQDHYNELFGAGIGITGHQYYITLETVIEYSSINPQSYDMSVFDIVPNTHTQIDHVTYTYRILSESTTNPWTTIGTSNTVPIFTYSGWSPPGVGDYEIRATAYEASSAEVGKAIIFARSTIRTKPTANTPWIIFPKSEYRTGEPIFMRGTASDSHTWVEGMYYNIRYERNNEIQPFLETTAYSGNKEPWNASIRAQHTDQGVRTSHTLTVEAVALDNYYTASDPGPAIVHSFTVTEHNPPTVSIDNLSTGAVLHKGGFVIVHVTAEDLLNWDDKEGGISQLTYQVTRLADGVIILPESDVNGDGVIDINDCFLDPAGPFPQSFLFYVREAGDHTILVKATDTDGIPRTSSITIHVIEYEPPTVSILSPGNGDSLNINTTISVEIFAEDPYNWNRLPGALTGVSYTITRGFNGQLIHPNEITDINGDTIIDINDMKLDVTAGFPQTLTFTSTMKDSFVVTASATDSDNITRDTSITFFTVNPNDPFSFELPGRPWTSATAGLTNDTENKTEGAFSLVINNTGNMAITSPPFPTSDFDHLSREISLDVYMPPVITPDPGGYGTITLYINNYILGTIDLSTFSGNLGQWVNVSFAVPDGLYRRFQESHFNMVAKIVFNTQQTGEKYRIDNLHFTGTIMERTASIPQNPVLSTIIQAEDFNFGGPNNAYYDTTVGNEGDVYRFSNVDIGLCNPIPGSNSYAVGWTESGEWLQYTINVSQPGNYKLSLNYAALEAGGSFHLELNGSQLTDTVTLDATGGWENWQLLEIPDFPLTMGQHNFRFVIDSPGFNLDKFSFNKVSRAPAAVHNIPGTIEVEHYDKGGEGVSYHDTDYNNQGGEAVYNDRVDIERHAEGSFVGYHIGYIADGEWVEYTIANVDAGVYDIDIEFASQDNQGGKGVTVSLDGIILGTAWAWNTGGWENWETMTITDVSIPAGTNGLLRLDFAGEYYNINNITFNPNRLVNGEFSDDLSNWTLTNHDGASSSFQHYLKQMQIDISWGGNEHWNVQVTQAGVSVRNGKTYVVTFDAMASVPRDINVTVGMANDPWISYGIDDFSLTTTMTTYSYTFTMTEPTDNNARFEFNLGEDEQVVTIDNVSIVELFDPDLLENGDFGSNFDHWNLNTYEGASANFQNTAGTLEALINWGGNENWHVQVTQAGLPVQNGRSYTVTFDARAAAARVINMNIGMANDPYTSYGGRDYSLTTTMTTYSYTFTMNQPSDSNTRFEFNLGNNSQDVIIDNVSMVIQ